MARTETVTVAFTDLVGSTELASRIGHDAYELLRHSHFERLRSAVANHNGIEIKTTGDGLMLHFTSTADAVDCAAAMQQSAGINLGQSGAALLEIRIGISSGEATREGDDSLRPAGSGSRAAVRGGGGGSNTRIRCGSKLTRGKGHRFKSIGELTLKGLPEPVSAFEAVWEPLPKPPGTTKGSIRADRRVLDYQVRR